MFKDIFIESKAVTIELDLVDDSFKDEKDMIKWFKKQGIKIKHIGGPNGIEYSATGTKEDIIKYIKKYYDEDISDEDISDLWPELD